jgi:phenylacetate-CoA ligase
LSSHIRTSLSSACAEAEFAYRFLPFYREHIDRAGLAPSGTLHIDNPDAFRKLPFTSKADFRRGFPARVVNREESLPELTYTSSSSGTTGERLVTVVHRPLLAERMAVTAAAHPALSERLLGAAHRKVARLAAPNCSDVECATPLSTLADRTLPDGTLVLSIAHDVLATPRTMVDKIFDELDAYRPAWLYADPTHLAFLCSHLHRRGLTTLPVRAVVLTYSLLSHVARRAITAVLPEDTPVAEVLSMSEFGWLGIECPAGARHLNEENYHHEILREDGTEAHVGEIGELVITSIGDQLSPHVRYRTGDLAEPGGRCTCGAAGRTVIHHGRASTCLLDGTGGRLVTARQADDALGHVAGIRHYRIDQSAPDSVHCRVITAEDAPGDTVPAARERLRHLLPHVQRVEATAVTHIEAERSGKFSTCSGLGPVRDGVLL